VPLRAGKLAVLLFSTIQNQLKVHLSPCNVYVNAKNDARRQHSEKTAEMAFFVPKKKKKKKKKKINRKNGGITTT